MIDYQLSPDTSGQIKKRPLDEGRTLSLCAHIGGSYLRYKRNAYSTSLCAQSPPSCLINLIFPVVLPLPRALFIILE